MNRPDRVFLVAVDVGDAGGNPLAHVRMEQPGFNQRVDRRALAKRARQADVRPLHQRRLSRFVERQQPTHLRVQPLVGERVRRQLIAEEAPHDPFREDDGVQRHALQPVVCHQLASELMRRSKSDRARRMSSKVLGSLRYMSRIAA